MRHRLSYGFAATVTLFLFACAFSPAQDSGLNVDLHANSHATAKQIGLPVYPGATLYTEPSNDSSADLGLTLNSFHFSLLVVKYITSDSSAKVLDYYRGPLARYGEVLECEHGKAVGPVTETRSGLTCSDKHGDHVAVNGSDSSEDHELRAGTPLRYRIVAIDGEEQGKTKFGLVSLELPKQAEGK